MPLNDPDLVNLATRDFMTAMQCIHGELGCLEAFFTPDDYQAVCRPTLDALEALAAFVTRYRAGQVSHAAYAGALCKQVLAVPASTAVLSDLVPARTEMGKRYRRLHNCARRLVAIGEASAALVRGLGDRHGGPAKPLQLVPVLHSLVAMHEARACQGARAGVRAG